MTKTAYTLSPLILRTGREDELYSQLAEICRETQLKRTEALPLALWELRQCPDPGHKFLRFYLEYQTKLQEPLFQHTQAFWQGMKQLPNMSYIYKIVTSTKKQHEAVIMQTLPLGGYLYLYQPGDYVTIKIYKTKDALQPRWEGPVQVLLCTYSALRVADKDVWIHHSQVKAALNSQS